MGNIPDVLLKSQQSTHRPITKDQKRYFSYPLYEVRVFKA